MLAALAIALPAFADSSLTATYQGQRDSLYARLFASRRAGNRRERSWICDVAERYRSAPDVEARRAFRSDHDLCSNGRQFCDRRSPLRRRPDLVAGGLRALPRRRRGLFAAARGAARPRSGAARRERSRGTAAAACHARRAPRGLSSDGVRTRRGDAARAGRAREPGGDYLRIRRRRHDAARHAPGRHGRHRKHHDRQRGNRSRAEHTGYGRSSQPGTIAEAPQNTDGRDVLLAFDSCAATTAANVRQKKRRRLQSRLRSEMDKRSQPDAQRAAS